MNIQELKEKHPKAFDKAYWAWCDHAVGYPWWDDTIDFFVEKGKEFGFHIDGDSLEFNLHRQYAIVTGRVDLCKLAEARGLLSDPMWFAISELAKDGFAGSVSVKHSGYSRSSSTIDFYTYGGVGDSREVMRAGPLAGMAVADLVNAHGADAMDEAVESEVQDYINDFESFVLKTLDDEYEYLTSEENFMESCEANEYDFNDEGEYK